MNFRDLQIWNDSIKGVGDAILQKRMAELQQAEARRRQDLADRMADISQQNADTNEAYRRDSVKQRDDAAKATAQLRAEDAQQRIDDANQRIKAGDDRLRQQTSDNFVASVNRIQAGVKDGSIDPEQARQRLAQFYTLTDGFDDVQDAFAMNPGEWGAVIDAANGKNPFQKPAPPTRAPDQSQPWLDFDHPRAGKRKPPAGTPANPGNSDSDWDSTGVSFDSPSAPGQPALPPVPPLNPLSRPPATNATVRPTSGLQAPDAAAAATTTMAPPPSIPIQNAPPAGQPASATDTPQSIKVLYKAGAITREEATARLKALGFQ